MSTTHPISTPVRTTTETETNFDGISYSKGSAVLKQLYFLVGADVFRTAMGRYMKKFEFSNAEFADLIKFIGAAAFEAGNPLDINVWADSWILTAGLNELTPVISYENDKITHFSINQVPALPNHPTLRNHTILVEAFDNNLTSLLKTKVLIKDQPNTVVEDFNGLTAAVVILNVEDWGYCKIRIDEASLSRIKKDLIKIQDPLTRQLVYRALWDMVRDTKVSAVEFLEFVISQFPSETDSGIANYSLEISNAALFNYVPTGPTKDRLAHELFTVILQKIQSGTISNETSVVYQKIIKAFIYSPDDIKLALSWVEANDTNIPGFVLGQLDRWAIIKKFATITEDAKTIVEKEFLIDPSDTGSLSKLYCEAAYPNPEVKEKTWNSILNTPEKFSRYERQSIMSGFNVERQKDLLAPYASQFYDKVLSYIAEKDKESYIDFCNSLVPAYVDEEFNISQLENLIPRLPEDKFEVARSFKEDLDSLNRVKNGKAKSKQYIESLV